MHLFDIFKGTKGKKGQILKIRNVGHGYYSEDTDFCELQINGLEKDSYSLEPTENMDSKYDYILYYEDLKTEELEPIGVGYLLSGKNSGLIRLEFDVLNTDDLYINLSNYKTKATVKAA